MTSPGVAWSAAWSAAGSGASVRTAVNSAFASASRISWLPRLLACGSVGTARTSPSPLDSARRSATPVPVDTTAVRSAGSRPFTRPGCSSALGDSARASAAASTRSWRWTSAAPPAGSPRTSAARTRLAARAPLSGPVPAVVTTGPSTESRTGRSTHTCTPPTASTSAEVAARSTATNRVIARPVTCCAARVAQRGPPTA